MEKHIPRSGSWGGTRHKKLLVRVGSLVFTVQPGSLQEVGGMSSLDVSSETWVLTERWMAWSVAGLFFLSLLQDHRIRMDSPYARLASPSFAASGLPVVAESASVKAESRRRPSTKIKGQDWSVGFFLD